MKHKVLYMAEAVRIEGLVGGSAPQKEESIKFTMHAAACRGS